MTIDEIIKLAREAERWATNQTSDTYEWSVLRDERFAALIRNEALEEAARVCIETGSTKGSCDAAFDIADACAAAIRARGK